MALDPELLKRIIEGALLAAGDALSIDRLKSLFEEHEAPEKAEIQAALEALQQDVEGRGYALIEVASGWRFQVRSELATWINRLWEEKPQRYSRALLETLALIAYRQPLTRSDIEDVRGVAVSSHIIKTLAEREWIKVVGHRDVPGRPSLYATTRQFLDYFGLKSLDELPTLSELKDFDDLNRDLNLDSDQEPGQIAEAQDSSEADETDENGAISERAIGEQGEAGASESGAQPHRDLFDPEVAPRSESGHPNPDQNVEQESQEEGREPEENEQSSQEAKLAALGEANEPVEAQDSSAEPTPGESQFEQALDSAAEATPEQGPDADEVPPRTPSVGQELSEENHEESPTGEVPPAANDETTKTPPSEH